MNYKKISICFMTIMLLLAVVLLPSAVYAVTSENMYMGIISMMDHSQPAMSYSYKNGKITDNGMQVIWNIVNYPNYPTDSKTYKSGNYYCLKSGVGFTDKTEDNQYAPRSYDRQYNMKTEHGEINKSTSAVLKDVINTNKTVPVGGKEVNRYKAIMYLLDRFYLPGTSTEEDKKELIRSLIKCANYSFKEEYKHYDSYNKYVITMLKAFSKNGQVMNDQDGLYEILQNSSLSEYGLTEYALTDNDIVAVQQAVLWYFTNYYELDGNKEDTNTPDTYFNRYGSTQAGWLAYSADGTNYTTFNFESDISPNSETDVRGVQALLLYQYLLNEAKDHANDYDVSSSAGVPIKLEETTLKSEPTYAGDGYIVGPIHMTQLNTTPYQLKFDVKDKLGNPIEYKLLDSNQATVSQTSTVKDMVGKDFYISVPKNQVENLTIDISVNYTNTTVTLLGSSTNNKEQPLVEVERKDDKQQWHLELESEPEEPEEPFDLKLIKRITAINNQNVPERIKSVDVSKLNIDGENARTTATYKMDKDPIGVSKGDIVTYTFRIYNEGMKDGYAEEITEDIPEGLQFLGSMIKEDMTEITDEDEKEAVNFNAENGWSYVEGDTSKIKTTNLARNPIVNGVADTVDHTDNLIKAFGHNDGSKTEKDLSYKEISVKFKVIADNVGSIIRNEAAITEDADNEGKPVDDRDSTPADWNKENSNEYYDNNNKWPVYKEDDEDYDNIILQSFDLALRKFIVAVSKDTTIENNEYLKDENGSYTREPDVDTSKLNTVGEDGKLITTATYNHTKEPLLVQPNDIVVYMLRVYNEGDMDGYAAEIKDHLPLYLEFVEGEFNKQYGWEISEDGRTATTKYLEQDKYLLNKAETNTDGTIKLSYQEVPIMCKVSENAKTNENITNIADITEYLDENKKSVTDRDSQEDNVKLPEDKDLPGYKENEKGSYVPGQQDDDDFEKVVVKVFDLALRKWVTEAIVIENGQQTITQTGHDAWDDPEAVVKVELHRKKLNQVEVKFKYSIRVYNQGEVAGYAKEVTDYIPEGLKFVAEDNKGWTDEGNNVISTKLLENTLLQPGEYADVEVLLTWINSEDNMGVMNNTAEISIDDNEYDLPDIDSTPDNQKTGEDDIDDAPVMLSISTGQVRIYFTLGFIILITIASGVVLIKKYVL